MKKSMRGSAAPRSTVKSPSPPSTGGVAGERAALRSRVVVSVTSLSFGRLSAWYQSLLILVAAVPGNRLGVAAGWRHDEHGPGDGDTEDGGRGRRAARR